MPSSAVAGMEERPCTYMDKLRGPRHGGQTWYSMLGSYRLFLQMAHVSVQMAHDHMATAFHFLISNLFPFAGLATALPVDGPAGSTSISSTSPWTSFVNEECTLEHGNVLLLMPDSKRIAHTGLMCWILTATWTQEASSQT